MKIIASTLILLLSNAALSNAQKDENLAPSYELMRASESLDDAINNYLSQSGGVQPECMDPVENYINCISVPEDIDDTEFLVHPLIKPGLTLGELTGFDYEMGKGMIQALRDSLDISGCDEVGKYGLATYGWLSADDITTPVTAAALVKDFKNADGETIICATDPLTEATTEVISTLFNSEFNTIRATAVTMMAEKNVLDAISTMQNGSSNVQPVCMDPVGHFVSCITISEDVDKTEFVAHPLVPEGMTLGDLKGTADYDMALGMIKSVQETINPGECAEVGNAGLANYDWLSINDFSTPIGATSFVKDFMAPPPTRRRLGSSSGKRKEQSMMRYACFSGAIDEYSDEEGPSDFFKTSVKVMTVSTKIDQTIERFKASLKAEQPTCMHPTTNYVGCFTAEDDIDDTTFVLHPVVPVGTTIGSLKGTDSYDPAVAMVEAMTKSVTPKGCDETGNVGLATYKWLSSTDFTTPVTVTALVKDFRTADGQRYICASAPLEEY